VIEVITANIASQNSEAASLQQKVTGYLLLAAHTASVCATTSNISMNEFRQATKLLRPKVEVGSSSALSESSP